MVKRISQIILTLTILLTVLGNMVRMGVCPCHRGFFIGDCICNTESHHAVCSGCPSCDSGKTSPALAAGHDYPASTKGYQHSGSCDNVVLEATAPYVFDPPFKFQEYGQIILSAFIPAEGNDFGIKVPGIYVSDYNLRPPPDLYRDSRTSYSGFMRPALA